MSEKMLSQFKKILSEFVEAAKEWKNTRSQLIEVWREIVELLNKTPYKPRYDKVYLCWLKRWSYGPGNVYRDTLELRFERGKLVVCNVHVYEMEGSASFREIAEGDKAVEVAVNALKEREDIDEFFEKKIIEIAESLERKSEYFRNRNKALMKKISEIRKALGK